MPAKSVTVARFADRLGEGVPFVIAAFVIGIIAAPILIEFSDIPERQALARQAQQAEADRWDAAFCDKYGLSQGSGKHRACLADLLDLRRQEEKRLAEEAEGIL